MTPARSLPPLVASVALMCHAGWAQTTTCASVNLAGGQANGTSFSPAISADGRFVAFESVASDLVTGDTNGYADVFVHDSLTGATTMVSLGPGGAGGNGPSGAIGGSPPPSISADGRFVAFWSQASDLVPGDTNGFADVFVYDRQIGLTALASVDWVGLQGNGDSGFYGGVSISSDGRYVAFDSLASNLVAGDTNGALDIFVHDLQTGATSRVSVDPGGVQSNGYSYAPSITEGGRYVVFTSNASNLVPGDTNAVEDVFVHDLQTGSTTRESVGSGGAQGNGSSGGYSISSDGRFVAFSSIASNLVPGDTNGFYDSFVHDRQSGATTRVSVDSIGVQGNADSTTVSISSGGRYVAFISWASNLVPGSTFGYTHVFIHDLLTGATRRVSVDSSGTQGNNHSYLPSISSDGRFVAFWSWASNLVPGSNGGNVFIRDRGAASVFTSFCSGDGSGTPCPCGNSGASGHGCENSAGTGGALLAASGVASLSSDTVQFTCSGELPSALSIFVQGSIAIAPVNFGDGLRCVSGTFVRLFVKTASGGVVSAPQAGDPSVSARSAALGDPIPMGATRQYQVYYRDPSASFCPSPSGGTFNISRAMAVAWGA